LNITEDAVQITLFFSTMFKLKPRSGERKSDENVNTSW